MFIRCPKCNKLREAKAGDFGKNYTCENCHNSVILDVDCLAHFALPDEIHLKVVNKSNKKYSNISITAKYGYVVGPIETNNDGVVIFSRKAFKQAEERADAYSLMDHAGDYSFNRYIYFVVFFNNKEVVEQFDLEGSSRLEKREILITD